MSEQRDKFKYKFIYNDEMTEVGVVFTSNEEITAADYIKRLEAWLLFCRTSLHEMLKSRPELESDPDLN